MENTHFYRLGNTCMSLVFSAKSEELGSLKPGVDGGDNYLVCQLCDSPKMTI